MNNTDAGCDTFDETFTALTVSAAIDNLDRYVYAGGGGGAPMHHGQGSHPTFTPTRTNTPASTNTPAPTSTPLPPTATFTPGGPTNTPTNTPSVPNTPTPGSGGGGSNYALNPDCNPWSGGACPPAPSSAPCSRRVFLIPIVDGFGNGSSDPVTILGFALVYLEGYDGSCTGNSCDVRARFVRADVTTNGLTGNYDPDAAVHVVKLIE
jgi:hypothetical protein